MAPADSLIIQPDSELVDALGYTLRSDDDLSRGTFSNAPAPPMPTLADVARAAYETNAYVFRSKSRWWFKDAGWRRFKELSASEQNAALAPFRSPPPILESGDDFMQMSFSGVRFPYGSVRVNPYAIRPVYLIGDEPVEIAGAPYGHPPYRRCAACGARKRTLKRRQRPYCAVCSC